MGGFTVDVEPELGGRWRSLGSPDGHEWLWSRHDLADRTTVTPGQAFIDVGGAEECFPTIGGTPDHGDVWSRPWFPGDDALVVESDGFRLTRCITTDATAVTVDYKLDGVPGARFIWALHASLRPDLGATVGAPQGHRARAWPGHARAVETTWPNVLGIEDFDTLGPDDGSAMFCILPGLDQVTVCNPRSALRFRLDSPDHVVSFGIWRNLGGYPWQGPVYRNFVVEPMMGSALDLARAGTEDVAVVPPAGRSRWRMLIEHVSDRTGECA